MQRRRFLGLLSASGLLAGCGLQRIDTWNVLLRSDVISTFADERRILSKAEVFWTPDGISRVLVVRGTPYERGYQHGALLREEVTDNIGYLYRQALRKFPIPELFDEVYERMRPYIRPEYLEEMRGLAHGARLPLSMIHHFHILPDIGEWGGKKRLVKIVKQMVKGDDLDLWGTTCSNFCFGKGASGDDGFYTVRILDWGLHKISKLHRYPLITVNVPDTGPIYANVGWVGFLGAVSGMNAQGITLGEMGYGDPPGEILNGTPLTFLLREVLGDATSLSDVRRILKNAPGTNAYVFLMSDGKTRDAELYVKDKSRFLVFRPGQPVRDNKVDLPGIANMVYGGHYNDRMTAEFQAKHGTLTPELVMKEIIPKIAMPSNFQNVVYDPVKLRMWVSNAADKDSRAAENDYAFFDFQTLLTRLNGEKPRIK